MFRLDVIDRLRLDKAVRSKLKEAQDELLDVGEAILGEANKTIPHEEGVMQASGIVEAVGDEVVISYLVPYAMRQHEDETLKHNPGRRAKWLEKTIDEMQHQVARWLANALKRG